jgi:hypothetical protein
VHSFLTAIEHYSSTKPLTQIISPGYRYQQDPRTTKWVRWYCKEWETWEALVSSMPSLLHSSSACSHLRRLTPAFNTNLQQIQIVTIFFTVFREHPKWYGTSFPNSEPRKLWASRIRIRIYLYRSRSFHQQAKTNMTTIFFMTCYLLWLM